MTEQLEGKIKEFVDIAEKLPERYREKCFEVLLSNFLTSLIPREIEAETKVPPRVGAEFAVPIDVRALLQQHSVPEELLRKLFLIEANEVRQLYKITTTKKAAAQIQLALLTALENALRFQGKLEFSVEQVRGKSIEHRVYDRDHFKSHFHNNRRLFKSLEDEEHIELSPDGKAQLAEVILEITK